VKLVLVEPGSARVRALWAEADGRVSSVALYLEGRAALASARRAGRLDEATHDVGVAIVDHLWARIQSVDLGEPLARRAGELADVCALRGYDAIHLASAEAILDEGDVMVVSDTRLAEAAASIGIEALVPAEG
jgi:predicted nucleic acid-binding protein